MSPCVRRFRPASVLVLCFIAALLQTACRQEVAPPATQPGAGGSTASAASYRIGLIAKSVGNPVFQAAHKGALDAAADLSAKYSIKVEIDWQTPEKEDAQRQGEFIKQLVNKGVSGIAISCSDASKVTDSINEAVDKGVPVVCFDSDAKDSKRFCRHGIDDLECGKAVMRELAGVMGDVGVVAVLAGNQNAPNLQRRVQGVKDEAAKHPGIRIKDVYFHNETPQDAAAKVQEVQRANPDIQGWAMIGGWALFTDNALPWKKPGEVKVVSVDALPVELDYVRNGYVQVLLGQRAYQWGYRSVELLIDKLHNKKVPPGVQDISELEPVTQANVEEYARNWKKWLP